MSGMGQAGSSVPPSSLRRAGDMRGLVRDAPFVLRVAALLAFSYGLLNTVNSIPVIGGLELLVRFCRMAASAFAGIAPALALLLIVERHLPVPRVRRWPALAGSVVL